MTALVDNGSNWMLPLLNFRNELLEGRNLSEHRSDTRRNGMKAVTEEGHNQGNYSEVYRAQLLRRLLEVQQEVQKLKPEITLITNQELIAIQVIWNRDGFFDITVSDIYRKVYNKTLSSNRLLTLSQTERRLIREVCDEDPKLYELIDNLISLQESKTLLVSRYGINSDVEKRIEDFVNENTL
jgi:DNA sulfur modification protein DndC